MIKVELGEFANNIKYYLQLKNECLLSHNNKTYVLVGKYQDVNFDFCKENSIEIINIQHNGGSVVLTESAIGFAHIGNDFDNKISNMIISDFVNFLRSKRLDAIYDGNDILVEGYKTSSSAKTIINNKTYFVFQVSLNNDVELIKNICTKPMNKIPKSLSDFGVTREEVISFFEECENKLNEGDLV